ncbi:MAG TPA: hypothetical protein VF037_02575 [Gemmatimonadales bacterium]
MKRYAGLVLLALTAAPGLSAQASIVLPGRPLPPAHARMRDAAYVLRDTLVGVTSSAARLRRDFRTTSAASLVSRAREMRDACAASGRNIAAPRAVLKETPADSPLSEREKARLLTAYGELEAATARCVEQFTPLSEAGKGEDVRGYGNRYGATVVDAIRSYERALDNYLRAMRIPNRPLGAGPDPLAG